LGWRRSASREEKRRAFDDDRYLVAHARQAVPGATRDDLEGIAAADRDPRGSVVAEELG